MTDIERVIERVLKGEGFDPECCEVAISYVSAEEIRELNKKYRDKDMATDVLSFPMYEKGQDSGFRIQDVGDAALGVPEDKGEGQGDKVADCRAGLPVLLGDVVICREIAAKQAEEYGHSVEREEAYLLVHGLLHLLGYDHEDEEDRRVMREKEEGILMKLELTR